MIRTARLARGRSDRRARGTLLAACLVAMVGCGSATFDPASNVEGFRVLALRADPPDLHPGDSTTLTSLVVDPTHPTRPSTVLYLGCDPDPADLTENPCARYQTLGDAAALLGGPGSPDGGLALPPGAHFIGINTATYSAPVGLFSQQPADALSRKRGVLAVILAVALGTELQGIPQGDAAQALFRDVATHKIPAQLVIKRIRISEEPALNRNPVLGAVTTDTELLRPEHALLALPGQTVPLRARASEGATEPYVALGPDGTPDPRTEQPVVSWFTSSGMIEHNRTIDADPEQSFTAPDGSDGTAPHALPPGRAFTLWVVLRDGRGGEDWRALPGELCDPGAPHLALTSATVSGSPPDSVLIAGAHLDQAVDAALDGQPLVGRYQPDRDRFVARLPAGSHGTHTVSVRGRACDHAETALTVP